MVLWILDETCQSHPLPSPLRFASPILPRVNSCRRLGNEEGRLNLELWRKRVWAEFRADNLTRGERDVLLNLSHYGEQPWPSHATLAQRARCSVSTVQRALEAGRDLGLVQWFTRRIRNGWRSLQTSNLYRLIAAAGPVVTAGQNNRRLDILRISTDLVQKGHRTRDRVADLGALAQIRATRAMQLGVG